MENSQSLRDIPLLQQMSQMSPNWIWLYQGGWMVQMSSWMSQAVELAKASLRTFIKSFNVGIPAIMLGCEAGGGFTIIREHRTIVSMVEVPSAAKTSGICVETDLHFRVVGQIDCRDARQMEVSSAGGCRGPIFTPTGGYGRV